MTTQTPAILKTYFETGDRPTQAQFADLIDSSVNQVATSAQIITSDVSALAKLDVGGNFTVKASAQSNLSGNVIVSGALTPAIGIVGTQTNNNAASGYIGEYQVSTIARAAAISLTNQIPTNLTSLVLPAGDWDVWGTTSYLQDSSTTRAYMLNWISTVSASFTGSPISVTDTNPSNLPLAGVDDAYTIPMQRLSVAVPTTIYLSVQCGFGVSTTKGYGQISARRAR